MKELIAGWSLTSACNLKCMHCYNDSGKRNPNELNTQEALKVIKKLKQSNVTAVNFGGGECALRPDFIEICKELNKENIKVSYTTNGTVHDKIKDHLNLFHDIGVSIDFAKAKDHDLFRGKKRTFRKAVKSIDELVKRKANIEIVTCLNKLNGTTKELEKLYRFVKDHKVKHWRLNRYRATGRALYNDDFLGLKDDILKNAFNYLDSIRKEKTSFISEPAFRSIYGGSYQIDGDPSGRYSFRIQPDGEVSPSVFLTTSGGNIKNKSIDEIFDSEIFKKIRDRKPEGKCKSCNEYYHCNGGDAGVSYLKNNHFNGPDPMCYKDTSLPKNSLVQKLSKDKTNIHELYLCTLYINTGGKK